MPSQKWGAHKSVNSLMHHPKKRKKSDWLPTLRTHAGWTGHVGSPGQASPPSPGSFGSSMATSWLPKARLSGRQQDPAPADHCPGAQLHSWPASEGSPQGGREGRVGVGGKPQDSLEHKLKGLVRGPPTGGCEMNERGHKLQHFRPEKEWEVSGGVGGWVGGWGCVGRRCG